MKILEENTLKEFGDTGDTLVLLKYQSIKNTLILGIREDPFTENGLHGFKELVKEQEKMRGAAVLVFKRISRLSESLDRFYEPEGENDGVLFLYFLYFKEGYSLKDISDFLKKNLNFDFPSKSIGNLFVNSLKWKLRERTNGTKITRQKQSKNAKNNRALQNGKKEKIEVRRKYISKKAEALLEGIHQQDLYEFQIHEYLKYKKDFEKMSYLIDIYHQKTIYQIIYELKDKGYKPQTIANILNVLCKEILLMNNLTNIIRKYPTTSKNSIQYILTNKVS